MLNFKAMPVTLFLFMTNEVFVSCFVSCYHRSSPDHTGLHSSPPNGDEPEIGQVSYDIPIDEAPIGYAKKMALEPINGWTPREDYACWGLPGALAPTGFFDPLGFARRGTPLNDVKRLREAEVQHGRVAMLATVGYLVGEACSGPFDITGPANDQLKQVPAPVFAVLSLLIAAVELKRAKVGWVEPIFKIGSKTLWTLRDSYYPGDIGFDPLGLKPKDAYEFQRMQTKELQHGRLAMLGWAGMCSQELVNHKSIMETFIFYQKLYSGVNPYEY